ncbi:MAG: ISAs1 family transposase, partial [Moorea sp. SIO3I6]|nr:ISAs1 family transposase [Moorena sp. SIO3I6]
MVKSGNDYLAALKGNQPNLFKDVQNNFKPEFTFKQINKGHGRIEKRHVSICQNLDSIRPWPGLTTLIQVKSERQVFTHNVIEVTTETRYYISSLSLTAQEFAKRIRGYWGVENKVHYVRDVTQGEDRSRIRTNPLPKIFTIARNFTLNLYREKMFKNMAQAQRICSFSLDTLK